MTTNPQDALSVAQKMADVMRELSQKISYRLDSDDVSQFEKLAKQFDAALAQPAQLEDTLKQAFDDIIAHGVSVTRIDPFSIYGLSDTSTQSTHAENVSINEGDLNMSKWK